MEPKGCSPSRTECLQCCVYHFEWSFVWVRAVPACTGSILTGETCCRCRVQALQEQLNRAPGHGATAEVQGLRARVAELEGAASSRDDSLAATSQFILRDDRDGASSSGRGSHMPEKQGPLSSKVHPAPGNHLERRSPRLKAQWPTDASPYVQPHSGYGDEEARAHLQDAQQSHGWPGHDQANRDIQSKPDRAEEDDRVMAG